MTDLSNLSERDLWKSIDATALADQQNAHRRDVTASVAAHYTALIETGMDPKHAVKITRDYQAMLLESASGEVHVFVEGAD